MKIVIFLKINNHGAASKILLHTEEIPKTFRGQMMQVEWNVVGLAWHTDATENFKNRAFSLNF